MLMEGSPNKLKICENFRGKFRLVTIPAISPNFLHQTAAKTLHFTFIPRVGRVRCNEVGQIRDYREVFKHMESNVLPFFYGS